MDTESEMVKHIEVDDRLVFRILYGTNGKGRDGEERCRDKDKKLFHCMSD